MFRRTVMLTLLLALILGLLLPAVPASAVSPSQETAMRSALQSQFDAYARELNYTDVHEDAIKQLLNHALKGKGKPLNMDTGDPFVRSILNASLFRDAFVQTVMSSIQLLQDYRDDRNLLIGGVAWYDHDLRYSAGLYKYNSTADQADDVRIGYNNVKQEALSRPINANDKAMILVAGDVYYQTRLTHIQATDTEVTYRVHLTLSDTFNFDRDYSTEAGKGYDTSTAELITLVGKMMSFGLVDSFTWQFSTELQITVPNYCDHSSGDYRWELQGSNLASVTDGGFTANALTRIDEKMLETDKYPRYYYQLHRPAYLMHDRPWVVEWSMANCSRSFQLTPNKVLSNSALPYLIKTSKYIAAGWYNRQLVWSDQTSTTSTWEQYGVNYYDLGFTNKGPRVYRLENRIAADGSNMVWLLIDGEEVGPLNSYMPRSSSSSTVEDTGKTVNWVNGKDFLINYIGSKSFPIREPQDILYLQIWEDGTPGENQNYLNSKVKAPTCTKQGYTTHTCKLCSAASQDSYLPANGHNYQKTQTVAATCTEPGYCVYSCAACGDSYEAEPIDALGHSWDGGVVTKEATFREKGETTFTCSRCKITRMEYFEKPLIDLEGTTMTLGDSLSLNFVLDISALEGDGAYAAVTKHYADGRASVITEIPQKDWQQLSGNRYYISFEGVAAKEMGDSLSVAIYDADGMVVSNPYSDSIRDYAMRMLERPEVIADTALRTLYVDMLNYGTEAQLHFDYDTQNPANALLTQDQKAWASGPVNTKSVLEEGPGRAGTTLTLKSRITLDFLFSNEVLGDDLSGCYATVIYSDHYGQTVIKRVDTVHDYGDGRSYVSAEGLAVADYAAAVSCLIHNADGEVIAMATDSIEGYAHRMSDRLPALVQAIIRFGSSAYRYFQK